MIKKNISLFIILFCAVQLHAQVDSIARDALLLQQIQNDLQQPVPQQPRAAASANPDISVIGDFRGYFRNYSKHHFDAELHETEFSFQSVVDPYARADFFYSIGRDPLTGEFSGEIEEGYLTTLALPAHLLLKAGRFKQALGRINPVHAHALPFVDMPDAYVKFFGEEGMKDDGFSLSWLLPNHAFYQELTAEITDGLNESPSFTKSKKDNYVKLVHLKNFWDLTDNATLEFGVTGISGENILHRTTQIATADLTYKWKPVKFNTYKSVTFQNEFYFSNLKINDGEKVNAIGMYSLLNVQVAKRYFLAGRYDYTNKPSSAEYIQQSGSLTLGWYATEFQKIELEGKYTKANEPVEENNFERKFVQAYLRWIFVIGSHGAHQY